MLPPLSHGKLVVSGKRQITSFFGPKYSGRINKIVVLTGSVIIRGSTVWSSTFLHFDGGVFREFRGQDISQKRTFFAASLLLI